MFFVSGLITVTVQGKAISFDDSTSNDVHLICKTGLSDTIFTQCDSTYLMNKFAFKIYRKFYENRRNPQEVATQISLLYEDRLKLKDDNIRQLQQDYNNIKILLDSVSIKTQNTIASGQNQIGFISSELDTATNAIKSATEATKELKGEIGKLTRKSVLWGVGGFGVGALVSAIAIFTFQQVK
jgi:hypothetical protein